MSFPSNPLSLSVPEPAFESWLRDSGYLEVLDHRTTQLHNLHSTPPTTTTTAPTTTTTTTSTQITTSPSRTATTITALTYTLIMSFISSLATIFSLLTLNPFAKLTSSDFSNNNNNNSIDNWTKSGFLGSFETYSFPSSTTQAKMRVHENVKRFARHYAVLSLVFFVCSLYKMPLALIGLVLCLAVWELFKFCDARWTLERFPSSRQLIIRGAQCAVAAILFWSNVQVAIFCSAAVSYAALILHASFRKLTPANQPSKGRGR